MIARLVVLAVAVAACTMTGTATESTVTTTTSTTVASTTTTRAEPGLTTPPPVLAPDFTLELGDGERFVLAEADRPVYLFFWAEWCPVCRKELPMIDRVAVDYADRVMFVAPVWKSREDLVRDAAAELMPSGVIRWGLDLEREIFGLYQVPYQPVTVLIDTDRTVIEAWAGVRSEDRIRSLLDDLGSPPG